jgi:beta-lactam-binding protein with PASTA domain/predicted Ser/Thr protein kinase
MITVCDRAITRSYQVVADEALAAHARVTAFTLLPMDTTLSRLHAGQLLDGRYRVGSWIARGGMATVYLGTDTKLDRTVALKVAHAELTGDPEFVRRFAGEARSVARLSSPNVVSVYDQGSDGDLLYLVMEYVPGRTLRELMREQGRLGPHEALGIISGVLTGLAAAHDAGIVHRDVKPENVLLGDGNTIKVADFGLARAATRASHTRTGMIIGTAAYLAPEQVTHSVSDARTDVYAAGVMLFEMLTGVQPHTGENPLAVAHKHVSDAVPPPSSVVPGLPASLDRLVAQATSRDPDLRPADATHFLHAVAEARNGLPADAPVGPPAALLPPAPVLPPGRQLPPGGPVSPVDAAGFPFFDEDGRATAGYHPAPGDGGYGSGSAYSPMPGRGYSQASGGPGGADHTLVVPADGLAYDGLPYGGLPYSDGDGPAYPPRRGRGARWRDEPFLQRWLFSRRFVYLGLTIAVVVIVGLFAWWITDGQYVTVPQLGGMAASTAKAELQNLGFTVETGPGQHSNSVGQGDVVQTIPAIGSSAKRGATVTIIESTGPIMITVPQVTGLTQDAAQAELRKAGLTPGPVTKAASTTIGAGVVISTNPVFGTSWPQTKPVALTVSAGQPLPNLVGQQFTAAQGIAQSGGFQLNQQSAASSQPPGTITGQSPAPGTPISNGEVVTVQVSSGPPQVAIPNVVGMNVTQATQILVQAGFQVSVANGGVFGSKQINSESPTGQAAKGTTITITEGFAFP